MVICYNTGAWRTDIQTYGQNCYINTARPEKHRHRQTDRRTCTAGRPKTTSSCWLTMLRTLRFLLVVLRAVVDASLPTTLRPTSGGESDNFRSTLEVTRPEAEVVSCVGSATAALSKAVASAMSGGGEVAFFINGDLSVTSGVLIEAPSASPRSLNEPTSLPHCINRQNDQSSETAN